MKIVIFLMIIYWLLEPSLALAADWNHNLSTASSLVRSARRTSPPDSTVQGSPWGAGALGGNFSRFLRHHEQSALPLIEAEVDIFCDIFK